MHIPPVPDLLFVIGTWRSNRAWGKTLLCVTSIQGATRLRSYTAKLRQRILNDLPSINYLAVVASYIGTKNANSNASHPQPIYTHVSLKIGTVAPSAVHLLLLLLLFFGCIFTTPIRCTWVYSMRLICCKEYQPHLGSLMTGNNK